MSEDKLKYYSVTAKCGHVGRDKYFKGEFPTRARTAREAAAKVRMFPRVKHDHKDAILGVREITRDEFIALLKENDMCPYWTCRSSWQKRLMWDQIKDNVFPEVKIHTRVKPGPRDVSPKKVYKRQAHVPLIRYEAIYEDMKEAEKDFPA